MAHTTWHRPANSQASGPRARALESALSWVRALFSLRCPPTRQPDPSAPDVEDARDAPLMREDALREAVMSLSHGDGVPLTVREYQLLELLWRIDP
jgi:hypothetical protein